MPPSQLLGVRVIRLGGLSPEDRLRMDEGKMKQKQKDNPQPQQLESYSFILDSMESVILAQELESTKITFWGRGTEKLTGYSSEEVLGRPFTSLMPYFVPPDRVHESRALWNRVKKGEIIDNFETVRLRKNGDPFHVALTLVPTKNPVGKVVGVVVVGRDITRQRQAEEILRRNEAKFRALAETVEAGILMYVFEVKWRCLYANPKAQSLTGYSENEIVSRDFADLVHPRFRKFAERHILRRRVEKNPPFQAEIGFLTRSGETRWLLVAAKTFIFAREPTVLITAFDVTKRREAERQLEISHRKLQQLSRHQESVREQERTRIAREIHDELGQLLTGMKIDLSWLSHGSPKNAKDLRGRLRSATQLVDSAIETVRKIAAELRPSILDDLGLIVAIEWQIEQFQKRTGILCTRTLPEDGLLLSGKKATAIFRIFQETLTNIARHAKATRVDIKLVQDNKYLLLEIRDNGKGIEASDLARPKFGLLNIRERSEGLGGKAEISSLPGRGTTVAVRIPCKNFSRAKEADVDSHLDFR